jgi:hypothetical protein
MSNITATKKYVDEKSVEVVSPSPDGEGKAADAKAVYDELGEKVDKDSQTVVIGENSSASSPYGQGSVVIGANASSTHGSGVAIGSNAKAEGDYRTYPQAVAIGAGAVANDSTPICIGGKDGLRLEVNADGSMYVAGKKIVREADLDEYAKTADVLPRYPFVDAAIVDGVVTIAPYTNARLLSDGTAFEVAVGGETGYMRDCVLRVECGETAPTITWGDNFHPRTDAETDFACVAGKRNVYWITEHSPNEFCVAGWQETTGGNAE